MLVYDKEEPITENLITWVFDENSFVPAAKLVGDKSYSILTDHLGTPYEAYDENGEKVWARELDLYGNAIAGDSSFIPFLYQGQYYDEEIGLAYNRFRYYSPESGTYISQDPIRLAGNNPNFYGYTFDSNTEVDVWGLDCKSRVDSDFENGASFLITGDNYERFIKGKEIIGRADGQFVAPTNQINDLITKANGDISVIENALGIIEGDWQNRGGLYKIDISNPYEHNLRLPTSDSSGANALFIEGGKTKGGISEGIIDPIKITDVVISKIL